MWIGSNDASDEHLSGTPLGVVRARAVIALPGGQRFEAKAIDEMQGTPRRPSNKHRETKARTHLTDDEAHDEEEEPEEIPMENFDEYVPGKTAEDTAKQQDVIVGRIGQSYNFHNQGTRRTEVWGHTLVAWDAITSLVKSRLSLATAKDARSWFW